MSIVADSYRFVVGVDTHAATHTLTLIEAGSGARRDQAQFPTSPAGLSRAVSWINRRCAGQPTLVAIEGTGSYGIGLAHFDMERLGFDRFVVSLGKIAAGIAAMAKRGVQRGSGAWAAARRAIGTRNGEQLT